MKLVIFKKQHVIYSNFKFYLPFILPQVSSPLQLDAHKTVHFPLFSFHKPYATCSKTFFREVVFLHLQYIPTAHRVHHSTYEKVCLRNIFLKNPQKKSQADIIKY